jgi:hypothetical protein
MLSVTYAECHLVSFRSVTCETHLLCVVMLNVVMLSVMAPFKVIADLIACVKWP